MAKGRMISRTLGTGSRRFHALYGVAGELAEFCQTLYPLLVVSADDFGRLKGDAFTVKHDVFSVSQRTEAEFDRALDCLHEAKLVIRYVVGDETYLQIVDFDDHQTGLNKRTKSRLPPPPAGEFPGTSGNFQESPGTSGNFPLNRTEQNRTEPKADGGGSPSAPAEEPPPDFERDFWPLYPNHDGKAEAAAEFEKLGPTVHQVAVMRAALERQRASPRWQKDGGAYVPLAKNWLRGRRWEDEGQLSLVGAKPAHQISFKCRTCQQMHRGMSGQKRVCTGTWDA